MDELNKKDYKKELNKIVASDSFKEKTLSKLQQEIDDLEQEEQLKKQKEKKKIRIFTPRKIITLAATAVVFLGGAYIVNTLQQIQKSITVLQEETNFGPEIFNGQALEPKIEVASFPKENTSNYFIKQIVESQQTIQPEQATKAKEFTSKDITMETQQETQPIIVQWPQKDENYIGIYTNNIQEEVNNIPAEISEISTLPMYINPFQQTQTGYIPNGLSQQEMQDIMNEQAKTLNMSIKDFEAESVLISQDQEAQGLYKLIGKTTNDDRIVVYRNGMVEIEYAVPLILGIGKPPEKKANKQNHLEYTNSLIQLYQNLLAGMELPQGQAIEIYSANGEQNWQYKVVDAGIGTVGHRLLSQNTANLSFSFTQEGTLQGMTLQRTVEEAIVPEYQLLSQEQAVEKALAGAGFTYSTKDLQITQETIAAVELMYWNIFTEPYILPYYKFYIEVENESNELKQYIEYYVLAIE